MNHHNQDHTKHTGGSMTDRGLHPRSLAELIDNWEWAGDGTLGEQIQEAAEAHGFITAMEEA